MKRQFVQVVYYKREPVQGYCFKSHVTVKKLTSVCQCVCLSIASNTSATTEVTWLSHENAPHISSFYLDLHSRPDRS